VLERFFRSSQAPTRFRCPLALARKLLVEALCSRRRTQARVLAQRNENRRFHPNAPSALDSARVVVSSVRLVPTARSSRVTRRHPNSWAAGSVAGEHRAGHAKSSAAQVSLIRFEPLIGRVHRQGVLATWPVEQPPRPDREEKPPASHPDTVSRPEPLSQGRTSYAHQLEHE
jgi:hypothetical protein